MPPGKNFLTLTRKPASESEVLGEPSTMRVREESTRERRIRRFSESLSEIRTLLHQLRSVRDDYAREAMVRRFLDQLGEARRLMRGLTPSENG